MDQAYFIIDNIAMAKYFDKETNIIRHSSFYTKYEKLEDVIKAVKYFKFGDEFSIIKVSIHEDHNNTLYYKVLEFIDRNRLEKLLVLI